jgi:hypothetical protein
MATTGVDVGMLLVRPFGLMNLVVLETIAANTLLAFRWRLAQPETEES